MARTCRKCPASIHHASNSGLCRPCYDASRRAAIPVPPAQQVATDREKQRLSEELSTLRTKYKLSLRTIEQHEREVKGITALKAGLSTFEILPKLGSRTSEGTVVWVASDWHIEEQVGAEVGGLNTYTIDIAKERAIKFFRVGLRLTNLLAQDITIKTIVLALLGDYITNDIHGAENAEMNEIQPTHAIAQAQNMLVSGIDFILANSNYNIVITSHSGNHARTTQTTRFASENGHSLEYLMYLHIAAYYRNEPRVTVIVPEGMHSYMKIYDTMIRFHHGHAVKYGGGVGGIYIPVNKAIAQWNKARHADLDVFGHFHQLRDGGNFICNGSLIGYNSFALSIKADFEEPKQALFLLDKKRGRTCTWPILVK
jgi:hypothetical protein